ncbi:BON domain-containing protein [Ramlibacter pallidus]|uniref:BON domain-containing protein n=1 Tax=Ramlibacter pallidus TaxID=2780087 RepID=A0ABR9S7I7_9BURK|nr:BON domain-containing protein [Ramlibacter pallidus]MBE7369478.1 BON domain-containing protein [Ramlibacter pallidus]
MQFKDLGRMALGASSLAVLLALGACGDRIEDTDMPVPEQANVEINRQGMDGAKQSEAAAGVDNDGAVRMGVGDTSVMDPDVLIAEQVKAALASNPDFGALKIDVHSEDGEVTLRGRAPDPAAKERATDIARSVREVKGVDNQLTLG